MVKLIEAVKELKSKGLTPEEIAIELNKPLYLIRAIYKIVEGSENDRNMG